MPKVWGVGLVGAGLIAQTHAQAVASLSNARLVGVCSRRRERAQQVAQRHGARTYADVEEMLRDPAVEVIGVINASGAHLEPAVAAAEAGRHVLCEKPLEITHERIRTMIEAHRRAGTRLGGIFQNRYCPAVRELAAAVRAGRFGTVTFAAAWVPWWRSEEYYKGSWHGTWRLDGGGALMNQAIHTIDLLEWLAGPVEAVAAATATRGHAIEAEDTAAAVVQFANGAPGAVYGTTASWPGRQRRLEITGTEGTAVLEGEALTVWQFRQERPEDELVRRRSADMGGPGGAADPGDIKWQGHAWNWAAFLDAVEMGSPYELEGAQASKAVEVVLAMYHSARRGGWVRVVR